MMNDKKILSIETSGELCSVALCFNSESYDERSILKKHIHSEKLIPIINDLFQSNKVNVKEIDYIAVSMGPGSFTGLRIGMTAAKGIAFGAKLPIIPVPSMDALALEITAYLKGESTFCIINKANIEECYFAKYNIENGLPKVIKNSKLIMKNEIESQSSGCDLIFGDVINKSNINSVSSPRAISVAKWAYLFGEDLLTFDYDYLEPQYLKNFKVLDKK